MSSAEAADLAPALAAAPAPAGGGDAGYGGGAAVAVAGASSSVAANHAQERHELTRREKVRTLFEHIIDETCRSMEEQVRAAGLDANVVIADVKKRWLTKLEQTGALGLHGEPGLPSSSAGAGMRFVPSQYEPPPPGAIEAERGSLKRNYVPHKESGEASASGDAHVKLEDRGAPRGAADHYSMAPINDGVPDDHMEPPAKKGRH